MSDLARAIADDYNNDDDPKVKVLVVTHAVTIAEILTDGEEHPQIMIRCTGNPSVWQVAGLYAAGKVDIDAQLAEALRRDADD